MAKDLNQVIAKYIVLDGPNKHLITKIAETETIEDAIKVLTDAGFAISTQIVEKLKQEK